jgi:uroporphyrinogen-III decarboxylase
MWQVVEAELMSAEDYDRILDLGWPRFYQEFKQKKILNDAPPGRRSAQGTPLDVRKAWAAIDVPVLSGGDVTTPIDLLCGSRSLPEFAFDMIRDPDKVTAVMEAIVPSLAPPQAERAVRMGYPGVWVGGWRSAPCWLSPAMWNRFAWPYFCQLVQEVVDAGLIAILHLDSCWDRELARFRELPKGKCLMATDGTTDLFRAKEVLGDHMCLMGDVPATMFALGSPDEVYRYCETLIRELGPSGFILQSGCDIPPDAKPGNVQAMVAAATDQ